MVMSEDLQPITNPILGVQNIPLSTIVAGFNGGTPARLAAVAPNDVLKDKIAGIAGIKKAVCLTS